MTNPATGEEWRMMKEQNRSPGSTRDADTLRTARRRIDELRKRDVELRLVDRRGRPLKDVEVEVDQQCHDFPFGEQLWPLDALIRDGRGRGERARAWKERFTGVFNAAMNLCYWTERPRNDASKTEDRQGDWRVDNFAATVDWTLSEGMIAKGHPLFWSIPKCVPEWIKRYDTATQMKFAEVRVRNLVARFRGKVTIWDAVNEPMWEAALKNLPRRDWPHIESIPDIVEYIAPVLRWCREEDPDATFLINDYGMEQDGGSLKGHDGSAVTAASQRKRYLALMAALDGQGLAPDAIGLQSHTGGWVQPADQWSIYDEIATAGLPLHVTEFWADTDHLKAAGKVSAAEIDELQAEYVADYLTCAFGHPAIEAFFFWGFMHSALTWFDEFSSHEVKPVYTRVRRLLHEEWHTREQLRTDADGVVRFRGFLGAYAARVPGAGVSHGARFDVRRHAGMPVTLRVNVGQQ